MKLDFKKLIPCAAAVAIFFAISVAYFSPSIFQNKSLYQGDVRKGIAGGIDLAEYHERTGENSLWASRMFSGMPAYQIRPIYDNDSILHPVRKVFEGWLPSPANHLFAYMLGFFILLMSLRINPWIAIIGSVAFAFSTYYLIIIAAGHIWKVRVIELIPPTLAGIVWAYRGRLITGGVVTALFFMLQLFCNHIQMTYYFLLFVGIFLIGRFIYDYTKKQLKRFAKATAVLVFAGLIGFGANATNLILTQKHTGQTIRGGSELSANTEDKTGGGLERSYATAWSYGIGETLTLMIPNAKGGASNIIGNAFPEKMAKADPRLVSNIAQSPSYWADQPYTAGPVYVGTLVVFLFIFGLFVVKGYLKWVLAVGTAFSILLSWGSNFMWLTDLFLNYFPFYNKMRTVSSILIVAEFCIPILAILALAKLVEKPAIIKENKKGFYISVGLTAGLIILLIAVPKLLSFLSKYEAAAFAEYGKENPMYALYRDSLEAVRISIFRADAWRSLFVVAAGLGFIWLYARKKIGKAIFIGAIGAIVLFDLALVNKRYLNADSFVSNAQTKVAWEMTPADVEILKDKDPNYRVLNLSVSPFNDGSTSYYHKSIGGYHGAKLRRYQDIIEHYINVEAQPAKINLNVLNMLNTKYVISQDGKVQENPEALGHAWFVENVELADNADAEVTYLKDFNPRKTAVVDKRFAPQLLGFVAKPDSTATIYLEKYDLNDITYKTKAAQEQLVVFSEIYYDDGLTSWEAYIDGQPASIIRANYILRALRIPAGEHTIELTFKPKAYNGLETISVICSVLVVLSFVGLLVFLLVRKKEEEDSPN